MKKAKRKTLPKDFKDMLSKANLETLKAVFDTCDVNARGGYSKVTALMFSECPEGLAHEHARYRGGCPQVLIELGAEVNAGAGGYSGTPLHSAVDGKNMAGVDALLAHGADVNAKNRGGQTPLEYGLQRASNIDLEPMAPIARIMLEAGAVKSEAMRRFVKQLGENFEFIRADFNKDHLEPTTRALATLYELFDVAPVPQRRTHDGKSRIEVESKDWQDQHEELWKLLVPGKGAAATVQGEVIRITGRISNEILGNGGVNWDGGYEMMAQALCAHLRSGTPLSDDQLRECADIAGTVRNRSEDDVARLAEFAVAWVLLNPIPVKLPKPSYDR
jgi:hypothetical protein